MSEFSEEIKKICTEADDIRDAGLSTPAGIVRYDDIAYGPVSEWQLLDVYQPEHAEDAEKKNFPVIVSVHGGSWVYGDKERYQFYCMQLAQQGFAVVNFTYRLAPEWKFPAPLEDTNLVMAWILEHAPQYKLDPNNIFMVGDSAGAQILGLYACMCSNLEYAAHFPFHVPKKLSLKGIALNCGLYEIDMSNPPEENMPRLMKDYLPHQGEAADEIRDNSVLLHVSSQFPPVFLMTSNGDFLKDCAPGMEQALREHCVPYVFRTYGDENKLLKHVFHCNVKTAEALECNQDECQFFRNLL